MRKGGFINDSIHGLVGLTEYEKRIIASSTFNRLHDVYQNSTVYLTYPSNRTKRFEHSIGTMKLCSDIFFSSIQNAEKEDLREFEKVFHSQLKDCLKAIAKNETLCEAKVGRIPKKIPTIELDYFSKSLIPSNYLLSFDEQTNEHQMVIAVIVQAIRAAALLHDVGHPPYSHIVEASMKDVYNSFIENTTLATESWNDYKTTMHPLFSGNNQLHEQMGLDITISLLRDIVPSIPEKGKQIIQKQNLFDLLVAECVERILSEKSVFSFLHAIIDGTLDADRLDYVTRDPMASGMNVGVIDYSRIITDMKLIYRDKKFLFCVPRKSQKAVEDFLRRRFNLYKNIVYHHRVIKTDFLLYHSVKSLIEISLNNPESIKADGLEDVIPFDISGLWFPLAKTTACEKSNALSQWNDSWLITILKQEYYKKYAELDEGDEYYYLSCKLAELLTNQKFYRSLIKREEDYRLLDNAIKRILIENSETIKGNIQELDIATKRSSKKPPSGGSRPEVDGTKKFILESLEVSINDNSPFIINKRFETRLGPAFSNDDSFNDYSVFNTDENKELSSNLSKNTALYSLETIVKNAVERKCKDRDDECDVFVEFKSINVGTSSPVYFYEEVEKNKKIMFNIKTLTEISSIPSILQEESECVPPFYIYTFSTNGDNILNKRKVLPEIGEEIGRQLVDLFNNWIVGCIRSLEE